MNFSNNQEQGASPAPQKIKIMGALTENDCKKIVKVLGLTDAALYWAMFVYKDIPDSVIVETPSVSYTELKELNEKGYHVSIFAARDYVQLWISHRI